MMMKAEREKGEGQQVRYYSNIRNRRNTEMDFDKLNRKLEGLERASTNGQKAKDLSLIIRLPEIWQLAYANIYSNKSAITEGIDETTLDGMSKGRISRLIESIKDGSYSPNPVRRAYIPKKDGNMRPLGVPSGDDKLVQAVCKILLEQIYEPVFSKQSHGFRPKLSCHTAMNQIKHNFTAVKWFVEFDIKGFFDNVNHDVLIALLEKKIDDRRFIKLIRQFLKAGYVEDWQFNMTYSGTPQGGVISPTLSNIYLHELDQFMTTLTESFWKGERRPRNKHYMHLEGKKRRLKQRIEKEGINSNSMLEYKALENQILKTPYQAENTEDYKRMQYCRYADDFIVGIIGSYNDAKRIMLETECFLKDTLHLQLSPDKTCVQRASKGIEFLGYHVKTQLSDKTLKMKVQGTYTRKRTIHGSIVLSIPEHKIKEFCLTHGYGNPQSNKPSHRNKLIIPSEAEIIQVYNSELLGLANYYMLARDMKTELHHLMYVARLSFLKTLAKKRKVSVAKVARSLKRKKDYVLRFKVGEHWQSIQFFNFRNWIRPKHHNDDRPLTARLYAVGTELTQRIEKNECEYCGREDRPVEVHHIRKMKDLHDKPQLENWEKLMIARNRKTLILCSGSADSCHRLLHQGTLPDKRQQSN
jgi:RNA-directed DNA polymerase